MSQWQQTCRNWPPFGSISPTVKPTKLNKKPKKKRKNSGGLPTAGLVLNLDGSDVTTMYENAGSQPFGLGTTLISGGTGDQVGCWADISGQGNHMNQGDTGRRPEYRTNVQNGLGAMRASVSSPTYKFFATSSVLSQDDEVTILYVASLIANETFGPIFSNVDAGPGRLEAYIDSRNVERLGAVYTDSGGTVVGTCPADIGTEANQVTAVFSGGEVWSRLNGVAGSKVAMPGDQITANDYTRIFSNITDFNGTNGYLCELLVYNAALNTGQIKAAEKYLRDKWATP